MKNSSAKVATENRTGSCNQYEASNPPTYIIDIDITYHAYVHFCQWHTKISLRRTFAIGSKMRPNEEENGTEWNGMEWNGKERKGQRSMSWKRWYKRLSTTISDYQSLTRWSWHRIERGRWGDTWCRWKPMWCVNGEVVTSGDAWTVKICVCVCVCVCVHTSVLGLDWAYTSFKFICQLLGCCRISVEFG